MGIIGDFIQKAIEPVVRNEIAKASNTKDDPRPNVFDVPLNMQMGYPYSGIGNKKDVVSVTFDTLRAFSVNYDVARACINHRKRQIQGLEWAIIPKDEKANPKAYKSKIDTISRFFEQPYHMNDFDVFVEKIIEDMLVFDQVVLWKEKTYGKQLTGLLPVDSGTIRVRVTSDGLIPEPPEPAYQQVIKGIVRGEWDTDEMLFYVMNPRNSTPYGLSPLESIIIGVDTALKSQMYNANMLSEGSIPEGFFALPTTWTPDQIKDYQIWFDALMAGNSRFTSRIKFVPGGTGVGYTATKKPEDMRFIELEKWLLMKTCALFDVQPQDIGFLDNATYNNTQTQKQIGNQRGLIPTANFLKKIFNKIIRDDFGNNDLKFEWKGLQVTDDSFELDKDKSYLPLGVTTIDEIRSKQGLQPFGLPFTSKPYIMANGVPVLLEEADKPVVDTTSPVENDTTQVNDDTTDDPADGNDNEDEVVLEEMDKWETKCINAIKRGKSIPSFKSDVIDRTIMTLIDAKLYTASSREDVRDVFRPFKESLREKMLIHKALKLNDSISEYKTKSYEKHTR